MGRAVFYNKNMYTNISIQFFFIFIINLIIVLTSVRGYTIRMANELVGINKYLPFISKKLSVDPYRKFLQEPQLNIMPQISPANHFCGFLATATTSS